MNGHCSSCPVESQCGYPYKPTDCCDQRKFRPIVSEDRATQADLEILRLKQSGELEKRRDDRAIREQMERLGTIGELK